MSLIQTRTPENILEQMDSFHNHQAKGWAKWTLRHTGKEVGTCAMWGHRSLVVCSQYLSLQGKLQWPSLARGSLPLPCSRVIRAYSLGMWTRGCLGWGSALFPQHNCWQWKGGSTSLLPQGTAMPTGGWETWLSQWPSTGNAVRLKEYELERETVH